MDENEIEQVLMKDVSRWIGDHSSDDEFDHEAIQSSDESLVNEDDSEDQSQQEEIESGDENDDHSSFSAKRTSKRKLTNHVAKFTKSPFASAEEFAHLIENSGNPDVGDAQIQWEERGYWKDRRRSKRFKSSR
jgi:hypothetical protein